MDIDGMPNSVVMISYSCLFLEGGRNSIKCNIVSNNYIRSVRCHKEQQSKLTRYLNTSLKGS